MAITERSTCSGKRFTPLVHPRLPHRSTNFSQHSFSAFRLLKILLNKRRNEMMYGRFSLLKSMEILWKKRIRVKYLVERVLVSLDIDKVITVTKPVKYFDRDPSFYRKITQNIVTITQPSWSSHPRRSNHFSGSYSNIYISPQPQLRLSRYTFNLHPLNVFSRLSSSPLHHCMQNL